RSLVRARLVSLGRRAPRAYRVSSTGGLAFAAAVRMVDRVHRHTAYCRSYSSPALRTGLAELSQVVFAVSDFAHRRAAFDVDTSCFAGAQSHRGIRAFTRRDLRAGTRGANELAALARLQLYAMHRGAYRNAPDRQRIARLDGRFVAAHDRRARLYSFRREDVTALAIRVLDQRKMGAAVRIVLQPLDDTRDTVLVALEIHHAVTLLVTAALVPDRNATAVVATAGLRLRRNERTVRLAL